MLECFDMLEYLVPLLTPRSKDQTSPTSVWLVYQKRTSTRKTEQKVTVILYENRVPIKRGGLNALSKIAPFPAPCLCALKVGEAVCTNA